MKLLVFSAIYGSLIINWVDLFAPPFVPGYHLWLLIMYFVPFIPLVLIYGARGLFPMLSLGLVASLSNDLFHYLVGFLIFSRDVDLINSYSFQLGLQGFEIGWVADLYFAEIPVSSLSMGLSIYLRAIAIYILIRRWGILAKKP